jgi:hypothetical protein
VPHWFVSVRTPQFDVAVIREMIDADPRVGASSYDDEEVELGVEAASAAQAAAVAAEIVRAALPKGAAVEVALVFDEELDVVIESAAERRRDPAAEIDEVIAAFQEPLTRQDRAGGWNKDAQKRWLEYFRDLRETLRAGRSPGNAPFHLVRWLDHDGIGDGPLVERVADFQELLYRRFADKQG